MIDQKLTEILAEVFELKPNDINESLTNNDIETWDSLRQMDLVNTLEQEYDFELEMEEIIKMESISTIAEVVNSKTK